MPRLNPSVENVEYFVANGLFHGGLKLPFGDFLDRKIINMISIELVREFLQVAIFHIGNVPQEITRYELLGKSFVCNHR